MLLPDLSHPATKSDRVGRRWCSPRLHLLQLFFCTTLMICSCSPSNNNVLVQPTLEQNGSTATAETASNLASTISSPTLLPPSVKLKIPVTWGDLHLTGKLVIISANLQQGNPLLNIQILDLLTGEISTLFQTTGESWIYYLTASPVDQKIVMSYSASSGPNAASQQALYGLPLDGSDLPQLLFPPPTPDDQYIQAEFSADGKYVYPHSTSHNHRKQSLFCPIQCVKYFLSLRWRKQAHRPRFSPKNIRPAFSA
jgi:hypothetical protein